MICLDRLRFYEHIGKEEKKVLAFKDNYQRMILLITQGLVPGDPATGPSFYSGGVETSDQRTNE